MVDYPTKLILRIGLLATTDIENGTGTVGSVSINCGGTGQVGISATSYTAPVGAGITDTATALLDAGTFIAQRNTSTSGNYGNGVTTTNVAFNATAKTYSVVAALRNNSAPLPVGAYTLKATVNVTAQ
ncbi:hypothetical protein CDG76_16990 [Nostoc sp. 'Peltigera membranacea cyanobiont' 210A]|uniref:hypothetical protein n=1 Tax=Nostoc sp. 'Peltigera membranacea cyanobiont' 210A TaxID=2014529 RepID=UPI000B9507BF|nr:hypothetical protein [Nostoc sp. 'Peltigera membranacea cyanobiont' 210A]OYD93688.1 hypothetical protein CDG76_16990 [Nostoc sp. 'Peltigera membranacea cyanobiont' 210A]